MSEQTEHLILEMLRRIRSMTERIEADVGDLKLRMSAVENHIGQMQVQIAGTNSRMDRIEERLGRIERRLELVEA